MSTIIDVARLAGVSITTVSNVLNGRGDRMKKDTLSRVEQAMVELGFQPNRAARQLKTGQAELFGLLVPSLANPSYGMLAREIETAARDAYGYRVIVANTYRDPAQERAFLDDLWSHGARGAIVVSSLADERHFEEPIARGMVVVSYDSLARRDVLPILDYISVDNAVAASLATEHLIGLGHRTIAFVTASGWTFSRAEKRRGVLEMAAKHGVEAVVIEGATASTYSDAEMAELGQALTGAVIAHPARPTAAVTINDMMAIGLIAGLRESGLSAPQDMSVIGFDALSLGAYIAPGLTTIRTPLTAMAQKMVDRIVTRLDAPGTPLGEFRFAPELLIRGSTTAAPRDNGAARPRALQQT